MRHPILYATLFLVCAATAAGSEAQTAPPDSRVVVVQALLREERLYPGEINGRFDHATEAAVRRYQILHGLKVTGRLDHRTLARMNVVLSVPPPALMEADREFLRRLGPTPEAIAEKVAPGGSEPLAAQPDVSSPALAEEAVKEFLAAYLKAAARKDPLAELTYFAETVDYMEHRQVGRERLREELRRNRSNRARRGLELVSVDSITVAGPDSVSVRFTVRGLPASKQRERRRRDEELRASIVRLPDGELRLTSLRKAAAGPESGE